MFITECPRDAMQGWNKFIPTRQKIDYINLLLSVGFDVLDCGSFVSPKVIPQMKDTAEVLQNIEKTLTKISVIVADTKGAEQALRYDNVDIFGYPFSISETFQYRNTQKKQAEAFAQLHAIYEMTKSAGKRFRVYFSMAFGNPYGEFWRLEDVHFWAGRCSDIGVESILLSDTTGVASLERISLIFEKIPKSFPNIEFGAHFHNRYEQAYQRLKIAYDRGCRNFEGAIKGLGGCSMAKDDLVGNMPTEQIINFLMKHKIPNRLNLLHFERAYNEAKKIFQWGI